MAKTIEEKTLGDYLKDHEFKTNEHGVVIASCDDGTKFNLFILIEEYAKQFARQKLSKATDLVPEPYKQSILNLREEV